MTAYLGGNLVGLHVGRDLKGLVPLLFKATDCLFVAAAGKSLVQLDGGNGGALAARHAQGPTTWEGVGNVYGNFTDALNQQPRRRDAAGAAECAAVEGVCQREALVSFSR